LSGDYYGRKQACRSIYEFCLPFIDASQNYSRANRPAIIFAPTSPNQNPWSEAELRTLKTLRLKFYLSVRMGSDSPQLEKETFEPKVNKLTLYFREKSDNIEIYDGKIR
jgi:hypothetical protein